MLTISFPIPQENIKEEAERVRKELSRLRAELELTSKMMKLVMDSCAHKHPRTGYNERDGSWATPCIHCGFSY